MSQAEKVHKRTFVALVEEREFKRTTTRPDRHYTHAVIVRSEQGCGVWSFCGNLQLAQKQLVAAQKAWSSEIASKTAEAFIVPVHEQLNR